MTAQIARMNDNIRLLLFLCLLLTLLTGDSHGHVRSTGRIFGQSDNSVRHSTNSANRPLEIGNLKCFRPIHNDKSSLIAFGNEVQPSGQSGLELEHNSKIVMLSMDQRQLEKRGILSLELDFALKKGNEFSRQNEHEMIDRFTILVDVIVMTTDKVSWKVRSEEHNFSMIAEGDKMKGSVLLMRDMETERMIGIEAKYQRGLKFVTGSLSLITLQISYDQYQYYELESMFIPEVNNTRISTTEDILLNDACISCHNEDSYFGHRRASELIDSTCQVLLRIISITFSSLFLLSLYKLRNETLTKPRITSAHFCFTGLIIFDLSQLILSVITLWKYQYSDFILDYASAMHVVILEFVQSVSLLAVICAYVLMRMRCYYIQYFYVLSPDPLLTDNPDDVPGVHNWFPQYKCIWLWGVICTIVGFSILSTSIVMTASGRDVTRKKIITIHWYCYMAIVGSFALISTIVDMILHAKNIQSKGLRHYFEFQDPLIFRKENLLVILSVFLFSALNLFSLTNDGSLSTENHMIFSIGYMILSAIQNIVERMIYVGGLCCIIQLMRHKNSSSFQYFDDTRQFDLFQLQRLLADEEMYHLVEEYCKYEFTVKNLYMWSILLKFVRRDKIERAELNAIINVYFTDSSAYAIDCRNSVRRRVRHMLKYYRDERKDDISLRVSIAIGPHVLSRLSDSFTRFSTTNQYRQVMERRRNPQEVEE